MQPPLPTCQNEFPTWSVATATPRFTCEAVMGWTQLTFTYVGSRCTSRYTCQLFISSTQKYITVYIHIICNIPIYIIYFLAHVKMYLRKFLFWIHTFSSYESLIQGSQTHGWYNCWHFRPLVSTSQLQPKIFEGGAQWKVPYFGIFKLISANLVEFCDFIILEIQIKKKRITECFLLFYFNFKDILPKQSHFFEVTARLT